MTCLAPLLVSTLSCCPASFAQEAPPSLAQRVQLEVEHVAAPRRVKGGLVEARWLDDGSSLLYRAQRKSFFLDPENGEPRRATREDREREVEERSALRSGMLYAPDGVTHAVSAGGALSLVLGEDEEPLELAGPQQEGLYWALEEYGWSPDGRRLSSILRDTRDVHQLPIVDYTAALETVRHVPYVKAGSTFGRLGLSIFHAPDGRRVDVDTGDVEELYLFDLGWREDGSELLYLRMNRLATRLDLLAADPETGESRTILSETQATFVGGLDFVIGGWRDTFHPIEGTDRFLWISERDGWRHVYQYDYAGELVDRVTEGAFPVERVVDVDLGRERVYLTANAEERVYDTHLYAAPLAGGALERLTEGTGEHRVQLSPSLRWFVDNHSGLERPPRAELRSTTGELVAVLDEADVSALDEIDWQPGEPFVVLAADGETRLHGVLYRPSWFEPTERYPVIDVIYTGPFMTIVPNEFCTRAPHPRRAQALAQHGFVTVLLDPRGTTERGKAFQDATHGRIGELEIRDHVAALRQLAADRPYMDMERVGVYGHSWGGYFALRAMLTAPEVFHVGVAGAPGSLMEAAVINEPYMRTPQENPEGYAAGYNAPLAGNLEGELLILHGTADVNAPFATSMRMVEALIDADKPFDLLVIPGMDHYLRGPRGEYASRRVRKFFLEHLRGE